MTARIITSAVYPPIPTTRFDWSAVRDGYEPGAPIGYGPTRGAAIEDLLDIEADAEPCTKCNGRGYVAECEASDEIECHCIGGPGVCLQCGASHRCPSCDGEGRI